MARPLVLAFLVMAGTACPPAPLAAQAGPSLAALRQQALQREKDHDWLGACRLYDDLLRRDRNQAEEVREAYQRCLRRHHLLSRHNDAGYRRALAQLSPFQALELYKQVLTTVSAAYVDRARADLTRLFRQGLEELRFALDEDLFCKEYLSGNAQARAALRAALSAWQGRKVPSPEAACEQVLALVLAAAQKQGLPPQPALLTVVSLEFACGACNSLDEHTLFLTPGHYSEVQGVLRGRLVSVGIDLGVEDQKLAVARVYPNSPASEAGLSPHDRVVRIGRRRAEDLPPEVAAERLRGESGTAVELEVLRADSGVPRSVKLVRRPVIVPSVEFGLLDPDAGSVAIPIGRVKITNFQETTPREVVEALHYLQGQALDSQGEPLQGVVLDLRGNPGGLFRSAVQVAELFLAEGVICYTHSQFTRYNRPYRAGNTNPYRLPLVVLIDGDTASAAEVLAGALKDQRRAAVIGETTFGKNTIQCLIELNRPPFDRTPAGVRITVARFYSPANHASGARAVEPNTPYTSRVEEPLLNEARRQLLTLINPMPMMPQM